MNGAATILSIGATTLPAASILGLPEESPKAKSA
jgi:hypothetical protein